MQPQAEWEFPSRRVGRRVLVFDRVDSTNNLAAALAARPDSEGLAVLADEQSAGRGQHGRSWIAPPRSSVLLSVLLYPPAELCRPVILTAWAAVSVCEVVRQTTGIPPRIKWPNDVLVRGRKICGILIEQSQHGSTRAMVAGIGLNVGQTDEELAAAGLPLATSLQASGAGNVQRDAIAGELLARLDDEYDRLCQGDRTTLEALWQWHLGLLGKEVVAECADGLHAGRLREAGFDGIVLQNGEQDLQVLFPETILHLERS
jgi:BirA family biotin operon repressor/biotin-[acetyl-CoA-carboxylase] ligase